MSKNEKKGKKGKHWKPGIKYTQRKERSLLKVLLSIMWNKKHARLCLRL